MSKPRTHYVTTSDGVTIGGTVHGEGPPLVFLQGIIGDGDLDWTAVAGHLSDRFTCHLPSFRGRGLSGDHPDLSPNRRLEDIITYVESIEQPAGLVGWSGGGTLALEAAARSEAVAAVAPVEPGILSLLDEGQQAVVGKAIADAGELAGERRLAAAARAFARFPFNDAEIGVADDAGYFEAAGRYVGNMLGLLEQNMQYEGPTADDPSVLGEIAAPVMVLLGSETKPFFTASARYVADHVPSARIQEVSGAGHASPLTHPVALAAALAEFFAAAQQPA